MSKIEIRMDEYDHTHLDRWLDKEARPEDREIWHDAIVAYWEEDPERAGNLTYWQILDRARA